MCGIMYEKTDLHQEKKYSSRNSTTVFEGALNTFLIAPVQRVLKGERGLVVIGFDILFFLLLNTHVHVPDCVHL